MAARRKIRDENEAQRYLLAAKRSGVSSADWARARGIDGRSLQAWLINLERRASRGRVVRRPARPRGRGRALVELVPARRGGDLRTSARYIVDVATGRVEFGDDASMATLRQVIETLRSC